MIKRVQQFMRALFAHLSEREHFFVREHLRKEEQGLFYAMHRVDQRHAVNVARTAMQAAHGQTVNLNLLVRVCLLHDVGRVKGDLDLFGKVWAVLLAHFFPKRATVWAEEGRKAARSGTCAGYIPHLLYVYFYHPQIGAEKLRALGDFSEAEIIALHHEKTAPEGNRELFFLRLADEKN